MMAATIVASCGGGDERGGPLAIDDFPAAYEAATCAVRVLCGASPDVQTCGETVSVSDSSGVATLVEAVKRGTIQYDGEAARSCLASVGRNCLVHASPSAACLQAFKGQLPTGTACVTSEECAGGLCDKPCVGDTCCMGTCRPRSAVGEACAGAGCIQGASCNQGICAEYLPVGAPCTAWNGCAEPGFCEIAVGASAGTCKVPDPAGSPCDPARLYPCGRMDERCDPTVNRCVKVAPVGDACSSDRDCVLFGRCADGHCVALPTAGAACATNSVLQCQGTLTCSSGTCAARAAQSACVPAE